MGARDSVSTLTATETCDSCPTQVVNDAAALLLQSLECSHVAESQVDNVDVVAHTCIEREVRRTLSVGCQNTT